MGVVHMRSNMVWGRPDKPGEGRLCWGCVVAAIPPHTHTPHTHTHHHTHLISESPYI